MSGQYPKQTLGHDTNTKHKPAKLVRELGGKLRHMYPTTLTLPTSLTKRNIAIPLIKRTKFSRANLIVFALVFAAIGGYAIYSSFAAGPDGVGNVFVSPTGSDAGSNCKRFATATTYPGATVCASFNKAYQLASAGDTIIIENGTYGGQSISNDATKGTAVVTFKPDIGATVTINTADLSITAKHVEVDNVSVLDNDGNDGNDPNAQIFIDNFATDITLKNDNAQAFYTGDASFVNIIGGSYGPCYVQAIGAPPACNNKINASPTGGASPTNFVIDGVTFHDENYAPGCNVGGACHTECLAIFGANNVTVKNSKFYGCGSIDLAIADLSSANAVSNFTIENNFFAASSPGFQSIDMSFGDHYSNIDLLHNTFNQHVATGGSTYTNVRYIGNLGGDCPTGFNTIDYNVFLNSTCGTHASSLGGTMPVVNASNGSAMDYHLNSGTGAWIDTVPPGIADVATDIDGQSRPAGAGYDAGADEFGSGGSGDITNPTVSITAPSNGATVSGSNVTISATASDNVGVVGVQFKLDGANLQTEDTSSPYSISWDSTTSTNATHSLTAVARDAAGNTANSTISVTVTGATPPPDTTPPSVPTNLHVTATTANSFGVAWTASTDNVGVTGYNLYKNGSLDGTTASTSYTFSSLTCGTNYTYGLTAFDAAGNASDVAQATGSNTTSACPDSTPPTVSVTAPAANAFLRGAAVAVNATAADNVAVTSVQFKLDGANLGTADTTSPYTTSWDSTGTSNGSHGLTAVACDAASNCTTSSSVSVTVDNAAPTVSVTAPAAAAFLRGSSVSVTATAADNVGVSSVQFKLDGANLGSADTTAPYAITWDTTTASNASHSLTAVASDATGNTTTSSSISVTVDNTPPTVTMTAPGNGNTVSGSTVTVSANASDNVGIAGVQFKMDGNSQGAEDTTAPYSTVWDTTTLSDGNHTLSAVARDAAGNTTTAATITVTVNNTAPPPPDTTAPSVPTNLAKTASSTSTISLSWGASTDTGGSGLSGYNIYRNVSGGAFSFLTNVGLSLSFTDTGLSANTTYGYKVSAIDNASNESAQTSALSVTTPANPAPTVTISTNPTSLTTGNSSTLTWSSTNATTCTASGSWSGNQATSGSQSTGSLSSSVTYTLTCTGAGGSNQASASVTVNGVTPPPAPVKKGDCNGDGLVNGADLSILLTHYNTSYSAADFNGDGLVTAADLSTQLTNYGK